MKAAVGIKVVVDGSKNGEAVIRPPMRSPGLSRPYVTQVRAAGGLCGGEGQGFLAGRMRCGLLGAERVGDDEGTVAHEVMALVTLLRLSSCSGLGSSAGRYMT